jgi:hypothetical protein
MSAKRQISIEVSWKHPDLKDLTTFGSMVMPGSVFGGR